VVTPRKHTAPISRTSQPRATGNGLPEAPIPALGLPRGNRKLGLTPGAASASTGAAVDSSCPLIAGRRISSIRDLATLSLGTLASHDAPGNIGPMLVIDAPWSRVLELAWEAFVHGSTPIGALVVDADGQVVADGRGRRLEHVAVSGQLAGARIAHAEVNALAKLPTGGSYGSHALYSSVEPCAMCMGAVLQTGIGRVVYACADPYAGAARCMSVDNPQSARRSLQIEGPVGAAASKLSALLCLVHYQRDRATMPHVIEVLERAQDELATLARGDTGDLLVAAAREQVPLQELARRLAMPIVDRPTSS
jgi:tRNA(Arg) A34 adenosine deaminase TadA